MGRAAMLKSTDVVYKKIYAVHSVQIKGVFPQKVKGFFKHQVNRQSHIIVWVEDIQLSAKDARVLQGFA